MQRSILAVEAIAECPERFGTILGPEQHFIAIAPMQSSEHVHEIIVAEVGGYSDRNRHRTYLDEGKTTKSPYRQQTSEESPYRRYCAIRADVDASHEQILRWRT